MSKKTATETSDKAPKEKKQWWHDGVRFQCQGSGQCCISRGEYGFVFLTLEDRRRLAIEVGVTTARFTRDYCTKLGPSFHLKEDPKRAECMFLKDLRCSVYKGRPTQCRTWPFWPDTLGAKAWKNEVKSYCPGVGKGPIRSREEIEIQLKQQQQAEDEISGDTLIL